MLTRPYPERTGGIPITRTISFVPTADEVDRAVADILATEEVDALIVAPSGSAAPALAAAHRAGRRVGDDLLLAAYVDEPMHALLSPAVTSFDLDARAFGSACLELLTAVTDADAPTDRVRVVVPRLLVRASTAGGVAAAARPRVRGVRVRFFGGLSVDTDDGDAVVSGRGQQSLLLRLAVDAGTTVSVRALAEDLWPMDAGSGIHPGRGHTRGIVTQSTEVPPVPALSDPMMGTSASSMNANIPR